MANSFHLPTLAPVRYSLDNLLALLGMISSRPNYLSLFDLGYYGGWLAPPVVELEN